MAKTRQLLPAGLAEMPPGPGLAAVLARIELSRLSGLDCLEVMRARHRQANHEQARFMAAMVEVALCGIGPDEQLPRMDAPDEFAADEIRAALAWTRRAADTQLSLAWDLIGRLPQVFAALDAGSIDMPKARVFSEWTHGLTDEQAQRICDQLVPDAPTLTTGRLCEQIKRLAIALDPDWARRRYEEAVRGRKVVGYRNEDGTGNLCGYSMPADRVAAACAHIDTLAKKIKAAGDRRPTDHIKADLYLGMLDGSYTGWTEHDIITRMLAAETQGAAAEAAEHHDDGTGKKHHDPADDEERCGVPRRPSRPGRHDQRSGQGRPDQGNQNDQHDDGQEGRDDRHDQDPTRRTGVEVRVEITTLLGLDDHPAELPGWGHVHADLARTLVREQTDAEWRYALTDDDGRLLYEGITRRRPEGYPSRAAAPCRGGIVELQIKLSVLRRLAARLARLGAWATMIADLARQADQHEQHDRRGREHRLQDAAAHHDHARPEGGAREGGERGGRSPGRALRRRTQIRDRTCIGPGCRMPASDTDGDHTRDWAYGGSTTDGNIGSACRHDHRLKHVGGWRLSQPVPGHFVWTSRLGRHYHVRPPLIIQPLPDPIPRAPSPSPFLYPVPRQDPDDGEDDDPTWRQPPEPEVANKSSVRPDQADDIPPF